MTLRPALLFSRAFCLALVSASLAVAGDSFAAIEATPAEVVEELLARPASFEWSDGRPLFAALPMDAGNRRGFERELRNAVA